jgi:hypothetical protein
MTLHSPSLKRRRASEQARHSLFPKSETTKAIDYSLNCWLALARFLDDAQNAKTVATPPLGFRGT